MEIVFIAQPVAPPLDDADLVVQPFDEADAGSLKRMRRRCSG